MTIRGNKMNEMNTDKSSSGCKVNKETASSAGLETGKQRKQVRGVGEWASKSVNLQSGCKNSCRYCFAQSMAMRFGHKTPKTWGTPTIRHKAVNKGYRKTDGRIMFPTSHDITQDNLSECLIVLKKLLAAGNEVLIVSKPVLSCIKTLCKELEPYKSQIVFRFTIGSADNEILSYWEPNAPKFQERLASLKYAHAQGYQTSISSEPMLDLHINKVIEATRPFVTDSIWLGRVNNLRAAISLNCPDDVEAQEKADELLAEQTDDYLRELYGKYKKDTLIKYKDSIKKAVGIERPTETGLDV